MIQAEISWTPASGVVTQRIEYKLHTDTDWIVFSTVSSSVSSAIITGLTNNAYDYRIINVCSGSEVSSDIVIILRYYWGVLDNNTLPTENEIEASFLKNTMSHNQTSIVVNFTSIGSFKYWWIAEQTIEPSKNQYSSNEIDNTGTIGTNQDLFNTPSIVGKYRVYLSNYKTLNTNSPITLTHGS